MFGSLVVGRSVVTGRILKYFLISFINSFYVDSKPTILWPQNKMLYKIILISFSIWICSVSCYNYCSITPHHTLCGYTGGNYEGYLSDGIYPSYLNSLVTPTCFVRKQWTFTQPTEQRNVWKLALSASTRSIFLIVRTNIQLNLLQDQRTDVEVHTLEDCR